MAIILCKLPNGLTIRPPAGEPITLRGPNSADDAIVAPNGFSFDTNDRVSGYGITELNARDTDRYNAWAKAVTFKEDGKTKADEAFPPLENGSLLGPFADRDEARKEAQATADMVRTGLDGIDPRTDAEMKAEGVEAADTKKK